MKTIKKHMPIADAYLDLVKQHPLIPLKSEKQYDAAMKLIKQLAIRGESHLHPGERDYLEALSYFVEAYENIHYQIETNSMSPLEALTYLMTESGMSKADLGRLLGNSSLASQLLNGKRELSKSHVLTLAHHFHVEPTLFLNQSRQT